MKTLRSNQTHPLLLHDQISHTHLLSTNSAISFKMGVVIEGSWNHSCKASNSKPVYAGYLGGGAKDINR